MDPIIRVYPRQLQIYSGNTNGIQNSNENVADSSEHIYQFQTRIRSGMENLKRELLSGLDTKETEKLLKDASEEFIHSSNNPVAAQLVIDSIMAEEYFNLGKALIQSEDIEKITMGNQYLRYVVENYPDSTYANDIDFLCEAASRQLNKSVSTSDMGLSFFVASSVALTADDATVIGFADDILLPFALAGVIVFGVWSAMSKDNSGKSKPSSKSIPTPEIPTPIPPGDPNKKDKIKKLLAGPAAPLMYKLGQNGSRQVVQFTDKVWKDIQKLARGCQEVWQLFTDGAYLKVLEGGAIEIRPGGNGLSYRLLGYVENGKYIVTELAKKGGAGGNSIYKR